MIKALNRQVEHEKESRTRPRVASPLANKKLDSYQERIHIRSCIGGMLAVPPGVCAILTFAPDQRVKFSSGLHWLDDSYPFGTYSIQYVGAEFAGTGSDQGGMKT